MEEELIMKVLFATNNPAKVRTYVGELKNNGIDIITLKDIEQRAEIKEDGKNAIENAIEKAKKYYELTGMTTIGIDDNLFLDGLPENRQPGPYIRRVNGKRLTDDETIEHYQKIINELGGKATGYYLHGYAICKMGKIYTYEKKSYFTFVNKISKVIPKGYPLDAMSICPIFNKYQSELTEEEREYKNRIKHKEVFEFLINNIK